MQDVLDQKLKEGEKKQDTDIFSRENRRFLISFWVANLVLHILLIIPFGADSLSVFSRLMRLFGWL